MGEHTQLRAVEARPRPRALFSVKLRPPGAGTGTVPRPRLHEALDRGLEAGTVIVCAPAGSGKSALLADWGREQRQARRVAWVTLGTHERDPARFMEYALAALGAALGAALEAALDTPEGARQSGRVEHLSALPVPDVIDEPYLTAVAQQLSTVPGETTVVLDDFHHVIGSATETLLRRLLRHPVDKLRLVVLTRRSPNLGQTKLRLRGQLVELGPVELALTVDETSELLGQRVAGDLTQDQVEALHRHSHGWAAGLTAVIDSWGDPSAPDAVEHAARRATRLVADYLDAEVLHGHPAEIVQFLRQVTTVDDICGDLADALTGGAGGAGTLADLYRDRVFLEPDGPMTDERCTWYRWNPLVAAVLRTTVRDQDPGLTIDLHAAAAQWFRGHGAPEEAVRHALAAGDVDGASTVLATSWSTLAAAGETETLQSLLRLFDEERLAADPELVVITAFVALLEHDLPRAELLAREAQEAAATLPNGRRFAVEVTSAAVRLRCAGMSGIPDTANLHPSALDLLERMHTEHRAVTRSERRRRALLLHAVGTFELAQCQYDEAAAHLRDALSEAASLELHIDLLPRVRAQLASVEVLAGRLDLARSDALDVIDAAHHEDRTGSQAHTAAHLAKAVVDLHRAEPEAALASLAQARRALHPADRVNDVRVRLARHSALLLGARADAAEAEAELEDLREALSMWEAPDWVGLLAAVAEADQQRVTGRPERALQTLEPAAGLATRRRAHQVWRSAYAEALLDAGRPAEAREVVAGILAGSGERPIEVQALLLDSIAAEALGLPEDSLQSLARAVRLSRGERILRPFLLRPAQVRPLLERMLASGTGYDGYLREVLSRLPAPDDAARPLVPLTTRELEVLRALQGSATNEHVAAQMYISVNTLRSHIKLIHRKLGTASRREAVARGRRMGLI